jgi:hypothetical protein
VTLANLTTWGWVLFAWCVFDVLNFARRLRNNRVRPEDTVVTAISLTWLAWLVTS